MTMLSDASTAGFATVRPRYGEASL
ncbi:MAG: hypothetical protein QOE61_384, partial [Micromonosporaceae bacterium]|nr:hypothetical protein [Micromonosporaceae bacterium]